VEIVETASNSPKLRYASSMKLGFEETQSSYNSGSQSARVWTEAWVNRWAYCPHCGNTKVSSFPNNSPLADFFCPSCKEEFELKSQKGKFGTRVVDGAFKTKCERLAASNNPNLFLLNYDLKSLAVVNLFIVPKHFFAREIIEERKPLAPTARRAGWIGSNILLSRVPESGKRTSDRRYDSSFNICVIADSLISYREEIIDCDLRSFAWPGFLTSIDAPDASAFGPMNGPVRATTNVRTAARETCRRSAART
jgi:hypothetical protein